MSYEEEQQQQNYSGVPTSPNELYANAINEEKIKNIISQLDPENQLKDIEMRIRGYKKNFYSGDWEKIDKDAEEPPKLLITRFIAYLNSYMNLNAIHGNLTEQQINKIMSAVIEYIRDELTCNEELYELKGNYTERTRIGDIIVSSTFFSLTHALNGMESKRMWKALNLNETYSSSPQKNKWTDALKFWK